MKSLWHKIHVLSDKLHMPNLPNWLLGILALIFILRIPSFFEPYYYGDEMVYLTLGQGVRQGLTLYKDIHDNKPPLLYLTAAVAGNLFWFKVIHNFL
jgi:MFS superfamily sulfate permease-like transporter